MIRLFFYTSIILLLFLSSCTSKAVDKNESATNDSIQKYLELAGNDTLDSKLRNKYNDKAFSLVDLNDNDTLTRWYLNVININLYKLRRSDIEVKTRILIEKSLKVNDSVGLSRAYNLLACFYTNQSKNELAIEFFFKAKKGFSSKGLINDKIKVMTDIATTQSYANDFLGSIKTSYEVIKISKQFKLKGYLSDCYINIGNNLTSLKNNEKAIQYYQKAYFDTINFFSINNNIANCHIELKNYDQAYHYLKKNLNYKTPNKKKLKNLGVTNSLMGLYYLRTNQLKKACFFLKRADSIFLSESTSNGENYNQIYLSEYFSRARDTSNAIKYAKKAVNLSKSYKNPSDELCSLAQLIKVDRKSASIVAQQYIIINDSLQVEERKFRDKFAQIMYETDEIKQQRETAIKQKWVVGYIAGFITLLVVLLLIITRQRSKQKELQLLQSQQKANEEIYNLMLEQKNKEEQVKQNEKRRIAIELHDGVMNRLASTRLNLDVLNHKKDKETIEKCLPHISEMYQIEQEIRNIAHDLSHENFKAKNSFLSLVSDFIVKQNEISNTNYKLEIDLSIKWDNTTSNIKMNLYRIIQEASHNINKFAEARTAVISFTVDNNNICLSITDNGKGFDTDIETEGIGLKNIKQRVETMKGKVIIHSIKNTSTSLNIAIPYHII